MFTMYVFNTLMFNICLLFSASYILPVKFVLDNISNSLPSYERPSQSTM